jgi:hypothetical protein
MVNSGWWIVNDGCWIKVRIIVFIDHFEPYKIIIIGQSAGPLQLFIALKRWLEGRKVDLFFLTFGLMLVNNKKMKRSRPPANDLYYCVIKVICCKLETRNQILETKKSLLNDYF